MPDVSPAEAHGQTVLDQFAQRVAQRDVPVPPAPPRMDPVSIQGRIRGAVLGRLRQREPRQTLLTQLLYAFLTQPHLSSNTVAGLADCAPARLVRVWRVLLDAGLVQRHHDQHARYYTLTRQGEDWLLAVAKGEASK